MMTFEPITANRTTPSGTHILELVMVIDDTNPDLQVCNVIETYKVNSEYFGRKKVIILNAFEVYRLQTLGTSIFLLATEMNKRCETYDGKYNLKKLNDLLKSKNNCYLLNTRFKVIKSFKSTSSKHQVKVNSIC